MIPINPNYTTADNSSLHTTTMTTNTPGTEGVTDIQLPILDLSNINPYLITVRDAADHLRSPKHHLPTSDDP